MTGLVRADRLRPPLLQYGLLILAVVGGIGAAIWLRPSWLTLGVAVVSGWIVASVMYVKRSVLSGRIVGICFAGMIGFLAWPPHWFKAFAAAPFLIIAILFVIRVRGGRQRDVIATDRTIVPYLEDQGNRLVDAIDRIWGSTRAGGSRWGMRSAHSHGSMAEGAWRPSYPASAPELRVPLFNAPGEGHVLARFSNFRGAITRDDSRRMPHGLALRLNGGDAGTTDLVLIDMARFPTETREDFIKLTEVYSRTGLNRLVGFLWMIFTARTSFASLIGMAGSKPRSYTTRTYHGLNTFWWDIGRDRVPVRYVARPVSSSPTSPRGASVRAALDEDLKRRLDDDGPVVFDLEIEIGETWSGRRHSKERLESAMERWPRGPHWPVCQITLDRYLGDADHENGFDPLRVPAGVLPSDDEILLGRGASYPTSFLRRRSAPEEARAG